MFIYEKRKAMREHLFHDILLTIPLRISDRQKFGQFC